MPLRGDRILRYVDAFCPRCHVEDAATGRSPTCGGCPATSPSATGGCGSTAAARRTAWCSTLYDESAGDPRPTWSSGPRRPRRHTPDTAGNYRPGAAGLPRRAAARCRRSTPASCSQDITESCNLRCPTCFADSSPDLRRRRPAGRRSSPTSTSAWPARTAASTCSCSAAVSRRSTPSSPTLLDELAERNVVRVLVNTNGIRIARDDDAARPADASTANASRSTCSSTGSARGATAHHRGADLRAAQGGARSSGSPTAGVFTTLTMTAALGVNDDEIGAVVRLRAGHAVRRRRVDPAAVRLGPLGADRPGATGSRTPACSRGSGRRPAAWSPGAT